MSNQIVATPREFINAVEARFGAIGFDLAANADNRVVLDFFGPGSNYAEDALDDAVNWGLSDLQWLNPPYAYVFELTPRVFKNEIRDCILAMFEPAGYVGREVWNWR